MLGPPKAPPKLVNGSKPTDCWYKMEQPEKRTEHIYFSRIVTNTTKKKKKEYISQVICVGLQLGNYEEPFGHRVKQPPHFAA